MADRAPSRSWTPLDAPGVRDLVVFDGNCVLCSDHARAIDRLDKARRFAFAAIQDPSGRTLSERFGVSPETPQTNIVVVDGRAYFKSDAVLALARALPGRAWAQVFVIVPRPIRDWAYDVLARNRYKWFGQKTACALADPAFRSRIVTQADELSAVSGIGPAAKPL